MEALTLTRNDYTEALDRINNSASDAGYLNEFVVSFPDGMNTASVLEICRTIQSPTMDNKIHLLKLCVMDRNVEVTCPNGDKEKFCMTNEADSFDAFPIFQKEPLALIAITDAVYGHILKKYVRLSNAQEKAAKAE